MSHFERLDQFESLLDSAWERELALFFNEVLRDLEEGRITEAQARERIEQIRHGYPKP